MKVAKPMIVMVTRKVYLRPIRSPRRPKNKAPKGRTAKPAANPNRTKMNFAVSLVPGTKFWLIFAASEPAR